MRILRLIFISAVCFQSHAARAQIFANFQHSQTNACGAYTGLLKSYGFDTLWRLNEKSGTTAADSFGTNTATYVSSPSVNSLGPMVAPSGSVSLNGSSQEIQSSQSLPTTMTFSLAIWFRTILGGGKLIGRGSNQSAGSNSYDRHLYLTAAGNVVFGVFNGTTFTLTSPGTYADGKWHLAAATLGPAGTYLYVDGQQVGSDSQTAAESSGGYWRIGNDTLVGWPGATSNTYFNGSLADVAVANATQVTAAKMAELYRIGKGCPAPVSASPVIHVTSSRYGANGAYCDTTSYVQSVCEGNGVCTVTASNGICGDPANGTPKNMDVFYLCGSNAKTASIGENAPGTFACP